MTQEQTVSPTTAHSGCAMSACRAAFIWAASRYREGCLDPFVTSSEVGKILYLVQESGYPLNLHFEPWQHGPTAPAMYEKIGADVVCRLVMYTSDDTHITLDVSPDAVEAANDIIMKDSKLQTHLEKTSSLIDGYESTFGLKLLTVLHWIATRGTYLTGRIMFLNWASHRPSDRQIRDATQRLLDHGWLSHSPKWVIENSDQKPPWIY